MYNYRDRAGFHGLGAPKVFFQMWFGDIANQWMFQDHNSHPLTETTPCGCRVLGHERTWHPEVVSKGSRCKMDVSLSKPSSEHGPGHCWVILDGAKLLWLEVLPSSKWRLPIYGGTPKGMIFGGLGNPHFRKSPNENERRKEKPCFPRTMT